MNHSTLKIELGERLKTADNGVLPIGFSIQGCPSCMEHAITLLMVFDEKFRGMINRAGAEANKIRRGEKPGPDINPQHN